MKMRNPAWFRALLALFLGVVITLSGTLGAQKARAPILSGCEYDYPPYCVVNPDNSVTGFSVELLREALKAMGKEVVFKTGAWKDIKRDLVEGRIEVLPLVGRTPEREAIFDFTFPYLVMHGTIVVRDDTTDILAPADLAGKKVAVLRGDNAEEYLMRANLGADIIALDSFDTAIRDLSSGRYDAVVIQKLLAMQIIKNNGIANLRAVGPPLEDFKQTFCFATSKGNTELLATLNEGLSLVVSDGTFRRLYSTWFSEIEALGRAKSRIIVGGDNDYPPYEFLDKNGQPAGYNIDLTRAIAAQSGMEVEIRLGPWDEIRKGLSDGSINAVQGMFYSAERDKVYGFSPAHAVVNHVIAWRTGAPIPESLRWLKGKPVVVMRGDVMDDLATGAGLGENLVRVATQEEALRMVAAGECDYALVAKIPALYFIKANKLRNIRLSGMPILAAEYCYAVPSANGVLQAQFSQGLAAVIATGEYRRIEEKWLGPYEKNGANFLIVLQYTVLLAVLLLIFALLWSWTLRKRVIQSTRQLTREIAERTKAEAEVKKLNLDLERRVSERTVELEASLKELEAFSYAVSHDLRAPLRAMEGFSAILSDQYGQALDDKGKDYLRRIRDASTRMGQLIEDLLSLSRVTRALLVRKEMDISEMAETIAAQLLENPDGRPTAPPRIKIQAGMKSFADPALIEILLRNLLGNAIKYSAKMASPLIEMGSTRDAGDKAKVTVFWVRDNGVGFDMAYAGELFTPFHRLHAMTEYSGTGIGLVTVKRIVTRHGGRIWPEAEPDKGACFYFTLEPSDLT
ncbi:MAG TPA: transporter substrate-binding domain-containing protein [Rectinemataceae bacterium]|nr:transporter substrate-binding domain-containing protein [Rectinemataceae bacterium]